MRIQMIQKAMQRVRRIVQRIQGTIHNLHQQQKDNLPSPRRGRGDEQEGKRRRRRRGERRRGEAGRKGRGRMRGTRGVEEKKRRRR